MKKTLVALAALAVIGGASAQSTVSITGNYAAGYLSTDINGVNNHGFALTAATVKVGVKEDLGSGLTAAVDMQFDSYGSTSTQNFAQPLLRRNTSISLTGGFGQVRFDNTRSSNMLTRGMVGPVNLDQGMYDTTGVISRGAVDAVTYALAFSDFSAFAQWVEAGPDGAVTPSVGVAVLGGGYAKGPLAVGAQVKMYQYPEAGGYKDAVHRKNKLEAYATYDFGMAKLGVGFDGASVGTVGPELATVAGLSADGTTREDGVTTSNAYSIGVAVPLGAVTVGLNYAKRDINSVVELGANYNLSKRTALTAAIGRHTFDENRATPNTGVNGQQYLVAMTHSF